MMDILQRLSSDNPAPYIDEAMDEIRRLRSIYTLENPAEVSQIMFLENRVLELTARCDRLRAVLDTLARLGNEPHYGNSIGNQIARAAWNESKE